MRKLKGKKHQPIRIKLNDEKLIGEIIGLFAGDGYYANNKKRWDYRIKIYFNAKETLLIEYYKKSIFRLTGKIPGVLNGGSVKIMQLCSKEFCNFVLSYISFQGNKTKTIQLRDKSLRKNKEFMLGFLKGLTDADGYVRKDRKEIYYGSISKSLFNDFLEGLNLFGLEYKVYLQKSQYSDFYKVRLKGKEVDKFIKIIRPVKSLH